MALAKARGLTTGKLYDLEAASDCGGGGSVHSVCGRPDLLAKIIHTAESLTGQYARRLSIVIDMKIRDPRIVRVVEVLVSEDDSALVVGVLMERVVGRTLYSVTNPAERRLLTITLTTADRVRLAAEIARAFATLHRHQMVLGDAHHRNVMVTSDSAGRVRHAVIIEPDTWCMEYRDPTNGRQGYFTSLACPAFLPPEFQAADLSRTKLNYQSDRYALVLLVCLALFDCTPHAFAGSSLTAEQRIRQGYEWITPNLPPGAAAPDRLPTDPSDVPAEVLELLRKGLGAPNDRPTAAQLEAPLSAWLRNVETRETASRFIAVLTRLVWARTITAIWGRTVAAFFAVLGRRRSARATVDGPRSLLALKLFAIGAIVGALLVWSRVTSPPANATAPAPAPAVAPTPPDDSRASKAAESQPERSRHPLAKRQPAKPAQEENAWRKLIGP